MTHGDRQQTRTRSRVPVPPQRTAPPRMPPAAPRVPARRRTVRRPRTGRRLLALLLGAALLTGAGWATGRLELPGLGSAGTGDGAVLAAVEAAARPAGGSIAVVVARPGGAARTASGDAGEPRSTASLAKLFVVQQLLERAAQGRVQLRAADRADLERAVSRSDDQAMNRLWTRFDGAALVRATAGEFGLTGTAPPAVPGQWGQTTTTADDLAQFLGTLPRHLRDGDLADLTGWMRAASARGADGFDQAFGLRSTAVDGDGDVAVKQGWMCCVDGRRDLHSVGLLPDGTAVVLLGRFPESTSWATARTALDRAARGVTRAAGR
ncbi:LppW family protein [Modestobacter sp. NPDC049651]|uniref:LppW family protein n=1 Tax=unclassified Modestobacter TaxID=2643866 RepID=UPI0034087811